MNKKTYRVEEAAAVLDVGKRAVYAGIRRGQIPAIRMGRRFLIPQSSLDSMLSGAGSGVATNGTHGSNR
jgi:excisionase family DNA binding protein